MLKEYLQLLIRISVIQVQFVTLIWLEWDLMGVMWCLGQGILTSENQAAFSCCACVKGNNLSQAKLLHFVLIVFVRRINRPFEYNIMQAWQKPLKLIDCTQTVAIEEIYRTCYQHTLYKTIAWYALISTKLNELHKRSQLQWNKFSILLLLM